MLEYKNSGYYITEDGLVINSKGKRLKQYINDNFKYYFLILRIEKKPKTMFIHRLVAETYIKNTENKPQINHKDGNKLNNHFTNLEWVTQSENVKHAYNIGLNKPKRYYKGKFGKNHNRSKQIQCLNTGIVYESITDAAKKLNKAISVIHYQIDKKYKIINK